MALANLISGPRASACGTCIPRPSPAPPALITHPLLGLGGAGGGGRLALPRRGQGLRGPPGTKAPSWLPGWQEVGTAEGGEIRRLVPARARGARGARAELPARTLPGVWHRSLEGGGESAPPVGPW